MSRTRMITLPFILSVLFPLDGFRYNLVSTVEQVIMMYRIQEQQLSLLYFPCYFPLITAGEISCPLYNLNIVWNMIMILHRYVEQVKTMCRVQE